MVRRDDLDAARGSCPRRVCAALRWAIRERPEIDHVARPLAQVASVAAPGPWSRPHGRAM